MTLLEIAANIVLIAAVFLAARNHWSTWPIGIVGCALFAVFFYQGKLYANVTLQGFFIVTSLIGWWLWQKPRDGASEKPITKVHPCIIVFILLPCALAAAFGYGLLLERTTDANQPIVDSLMLTFSIIAQLLLMGRKLETWIFWILVNAVGVPLFASQGFYLTSAVYALFLFNAVYGYVNWRKEMNITNATF